MGYIRENFSRITLLSLESVTNKKTSVNIYVLYNIIVITLITSIAEGGLAPIFVFKISTIIYECNIIYYYSYVYIYIYSHAKNCWGLKSLYVIYARCPWPRLCWPIVYSPGLVPFIKSSLLCPLPRLCSVELYPKTVI